MPDPFLSLLLRPQGLAGSTPEQCLRARYSKAQRGRTSIFGRSRSSISRLSTFNFFGRLRTYVRRQPPSWNCTDAYNPAYASTRSPHRTSHERVRTSSGSVSEDIWRWMAAVRAAARLERVILASLMPRASIGVKASTDLRGEVLGTMPGM